MRNAFVRFPRVADRREADAGGLLNQILGFVDARPAGTMMDHSFDGHEDQPGDMSVAVGVVDFLLRDRVAKRRPTAVDFEGLRHALSGRAQHLVMQPAIERYYVASATSPAKQRAASIA